jgi:hypothetical protein
VTVPFPLRFEGCRFEFPLQVSGATLQELTMLECELAGLLGNDVDVRRDLDLSGSTVTGITFAVPLVGGRLGGGSD